MKTLGLSVALSNVAIEAAAKKMSQSALLEMVEGILLQYADVLGKATGSSEQQKSLGADLRLSEFHFDYEQHSIQVQFANFLPRGDWQVQGIRLF
jgi:hypothetical protein